jgi:N-ethylmaleimide reductase
MTIAAKKLFTPVQIGPITLKHRIVMPAMTRHRAHNPGAIPSDLQREFFTQRATDGGLMLPEGIGISQAGFGIWGSPGIWTEDQVTGWKRITDAVHAKGAVVFAQLWHGGRSAHISTSITTPVAPSVVPSYWEDGKSIVSTPQGWQTPSPHRALETDEIPGVIGEFRNAAINAQTAGFDGVELHGAYGYLIDQFLQDGSNKRTDQYGGSIENRARLLFKIVEAVSSVWGSDRCGVRIAPSSHYNGMGDSDPHALFAFVADKLNDYNPAYLHIIEPRMQGIDLAVAGQGPVATQELRKLFHGTIIAAGGFEPDTAEQAIAAGDADLVSFARHFIANPDLPERIRLDLPLNPHDRDTFYTFDAHGYTDYPFHGDKATTEA